MPTRPMTAPEIADDIAERIRSGEYEPGVKLPYEDLMELYAFEGERASRSKIQRAMSRLEARGVVEYRPGVGTFVADHSG